MRDPLPGVGAALGLIVLAVVIVAVVAALAGCHPEPGLRPVDTTRLPLAPPASPVPAPSPGPILLTPGSSS